MFFARDPSFVRSGYVALNIGYLTDVGQYGRDWSISAYSDTINTYDFFFDGSGALPSGYDHRYFGYSLRCLQE